MLQETLLALHLSRHTYDPAVPVSAWAHAIARYKLIDHLRRSGRHRGHLPIEEALAQPEPRGAASDAKLDVERALATLPERTRTLIDRVKLQGGSLAEAAQATGMTENAAKVAIHRGLKAMAKVLSRAGPSHLDLSSPEPRNLSVSAAELPEPQQAPAGFDSAMKTDDLVTLLASDSGPVERAGFARITG